MIDVHAAALAVLQASEPEEKVALSRRWAKKIAEGELQIGADSDAVAMPAPGRPAKPVLVSPKDLPRRGLGTVAGRAALIHAVAHIEFNAINLAWDAVYRFRDMPLDYYRDWSRVGHEEANHFALLAERLSRDGFAYGDFDAHNGLWEMAVKTDHDVLVRMALVPRVLEARGLDVTPGMIERLANADDTDTVAILEIILREEVGHVAIGDRWFRHCCASRQMEPEATFRGLLEAYDVGSPKPPLNHSARVAAGFSEEEISALTQNID